MNTRSPLRRALRMTAVFAGPGLLFVFLLTAFIGAMRPMEGARDALRVEAPGSIVISMNAGSNVEPIRRTFLLVPASFQECVMFKATANELSGVQVSRSAPSAFYTWGVVMAIAVLLTIFVSLPALWRLFRPHPALIAETGDTPTNVGAADENAPL